MCLSVQRYQHRLARREGGRGGKGAGKKKKKEMENEEEGRERNEGVEEE